VTTPPEARPTAQRATLSVEESAALLGLSRSAAYEAVRNGSFPVAVLTINGRYYVPRASLEALLGIAGHTGTDAGERADAEQRLQTLYREMRALYRHLGIELDRLAPLCGEADNAATPRARAAS